MADRDGDAGARAGVEHRLRVGPRQRERLFAVDMLAGRGRRLDVRAMARVRRRQHDRLDRRIGQHLLIRRPDRKPVVRGELARQLRFERDAAHEPDLAGVLYRIDEPLAPPAEANDRCIEHDEATPAHTDAGAPGCLSGWARANASMPWHASATRTKLGNDAVSTLKNFAP